MTRLFVSVELPKELREKIYGELSEKLWGLRVVAKENLHLTICFIGEENEETVSEKLSGIGFEKFKVRLKGIGKFGKNVVWLGAESEELKALAEKVCGALGIEQEFSGHLTLARSSKKGNFFGCFDRIRGNELDEEFEVKNFSLMKSTLTPAGPVYKVMGKFSALA